MSGEQGEKGGLEALNTGCSQRTPIGQVDTHGPDSKYKPILMKNMKIEKESENNPFHGKLKYVQIC